jgi:hypothetical protein
VVEEVKSDWQVRRLANDVLPHTPTIFDCMYVYIPSTLSLVLPERSVLVTTNLQYQKYQTFQKQNAMGWHH